MRRGPMRPERHAFVRLAAAPSGEPCGGTTAELAAWHDAGHLFVAASARPGDPAGSVRLGLATPDKRRIGFLAGLDEVRHVVPPPGLDDARSAAPADWAPTIDRVIGLCSQGGLEVRTFGSLAWTKLSGIDALHAKSDLDLLLSPHGADLAAVLDAVRALSAASGEGPRLDGELLLGDGSAVAFREYAARPAEILVKAHGGAVLDGLDAVDARLSRGRSA